MILLSQILNTQADEVNVIVFGMFILAALLVMFALFLTGIWLQRYSTGTSPYTGLPLRRASEIPYESKKKILRFLYDRQEYDNRIITLSRAVICRDTGRIFQDAVTWYDTVNLDWSFINKRFPGHYVSWGSLNDLQQIIIQDAHFSLKDFQTDYSCPNPAPKAITPEYINLKPGPLYVDIQTKVLVGWQCVPDSDFEVLIVQHPQNIIIQKQ